MLLRRTHVSHISTVTHQGKVLIVATVVEPTGVNLYYTVKQEGFEEKALANPGGSGWEDFTRLEFPDEPDGDPSVEAREVTDLTDRFGRRLLRSIYRSAHLTADAPVRLVSHDGHCHVFRQSTTGTLLVDRFVLDGMANRLRPKIEVRFKRSRQRHVPHKDMRLAAGGKMESLDSPDFQDMTNRSFVEPTTEFGEHLTGRLQGGWFDVVITPSNEKGTHRWHVIVRTDGSTFRILTVRAGAERVVDVQDSLFRTIDPVTDAVSYGNVPGLVERTLTLCDAAGTPLTVTGGPSATRFDVQRARQTQNGQQLVRESGRVLLAVPTAAGTAALTFGIAADGSLARITGDDPEQSLLRSRRREVLLPIDVLDEIRPIGDSTPGPAGTITAICRSTEDGRADRLRVRVSDRDRADNGQLRGGDTVKLSADTRDGLHTVSSPDAGGFVIDAPAGSGELGTWEKVQTEETGLVFDGMVTAYEQLPDGKLRVQAVNHGLADGDLVQLVGDGGYSGEHAVLQRDDDGFTVDRRWAAAEAVDVQLVSRRRRGLVLDGRDDWITAPFAQPVNLSGGFSVEAWVRLTGGADGTVADQTILALQPELSPDGPPVDAAATMLALAVRDGRLTGYVTRPLLGRTGALRLDTATALPADRWIHVACSFDAANLTLLLDGAEAATTTAAVLDDKAGAALAAAQDRTAEDRTAQVRAAFTLRLSAVAMGARPRPDGSRDDLLRGQLADVRVWSAGRTAATIADRMHLQLTGRETALIGYWRLGGVTTDEDGVGRVVDFSVNANHGLVRGAPTGGAVTVSRTLRDRTTKAVKLSNPDLVAVSESGTYEESFEFRVSGPADAAGTPLFVPSLWGRSSRGATEIQRFEASSTYTIEPADDGWYVATCTFVVPDGVRLVRCFEVADVTGSWETMEIRRLALTSVSDTVTLSESTERPAVAALGGPLTPPVSPTLLPELAGHERTEMSLVIRRDELTGLLADSADQTAAQARRAQQQNTVDAARREENARQSELDRTEAWTLNFWCSLTALSEIGHYLSARADYDTDHVVGRSQYPQREAMHWRFEHVDVGGSNWYVITNRRLGTCLQPDTENDGVRVAPRRSTDEQLWRLSQRGDSFVLENRARGRVLDSPGQMPGVIHFPEHGNANQCWRLRSVGDPCGTEVENARTAATLARQAREQAEAELQRLDQVLAATEGKRAEWTRQLADTTRRLEEVQTSIARATTAYLAAAGAAADGVSMPDLRAGNDPVGPPVQGALLASVLPAGPVHVAESCTGLVELTYQDRNGIVRRARYDAVYGDTDGAGGNGETWVSQGLRAALSLSGSGRGQAIPAGAVDAATGRLTIEFWARAGSGEPRRAPFLTAFDDGGVRRLCIDLPDGTRPGPAGSAGDTVVWEAGTSAGGAIDRVSATVAAHRSGWSHWAFVKDVDKGEMRIHRDGELVTTSQFARDQGRQPLAGISRITLGAPGADGRGWQGQVCELRIWNVALTEREIEAHSVLTPTGHEPGLVAYHPMDEGTGTTARDRTGGGRNLDTDGAWAASTAPIGRVLGAPGPVEDLLDGPRTFDAAGSHVQLPTLHLTPSAGLTIEARVTFRAFNTWSRIIDLGNGPDSASIILANRAETARLVLMVFGNTGPMSSLDASTDLVAGRPTHVVATIAADGAACIYLDGAVVASGRLSVPVDTARTRNFVGHSNWDHDRDFRGEMDYVRLYRRVLDADTVRRLATASASPAAVLCAEYSRVTVDAVGRKSVMMNRCLATPTAEGVRLLDGQRIEELDLTWVGNAQIKPTLIGYVEGAPPLPSENLTEEEDYNGATSVELVQSADTEYSWTREQDVSTGVEAEVLLGAKSESSAGIGVMTSVEEIKTGGGGRFDLAYHFQTASRVGVSHSLMSSDRLELRGSQESTPHFPHLDKRFVPKGVGYALVTSGLADVFVTRLRRSGRMVGMQILPVEGVPIDVNTITFMINPAYTMAGSLDGMTGSRATSDRFHRHVPAMRAQYGSLYPASYFRLTEAYAWKNRIDQQDKMHEAYFHQFSSRLVDEVQLNRQTGDTSLDASAVSVGGGDLDEKIQTKRAEVDRLRQSGPVAEKSRAEAELKELEDEKAAASAKQDKEQEGRREAGADRQKRIAATHTDLSARANASDGFAAWQKRMEALNVRAGKRNIVNTYVWDADGGLRAEEQQFAGTVEHSIGGSLDFGAALGGQASIALAKVLVEFNAYATVNLTQTMSKTQTSSRGLELHVDLSGVESRGVTDFRDQPIQPGEKVDRYRFMSFFLEGSNDHWHDFFNHVVDPEWLASNDEEACALRDARDATPNAAWRVLHRVTYVERPATMGIGRPTVDEEEAEDDVRVLREQVRGLQTDISTLRSEVAGTLEQLLARTKE